MGLHRDLMPIPVPNSAHISNCDNRVYLLNKSFENNQKKWVKIVIGRTLPNNKALMHPNHNFKTLFPSKWKDFYGDEGVKTPILFIGFYLIVLYIVHALGIYNLLIRMYGILKANTTIDFCMYTILEETNAVQHYESTMKNHALFSNTIHKNSWYSNFFNNEITEEQNIEFKNSWLKETIEKYKINKLTIAASVDGSNNDCKVKNSELPQKGHSKSKNNCNIISYIWVMDADNKIPLTYYVYHGSIPDCKALNKIIISFNDLGLEVDPLILDRNFATHEVISDLNKLNIPYIINLKSNSFGHKEMVKKFGLSLQWNPCYNINSEILAGTTEENQIFESHEEKGFIHLYYHKDNGHERRKAYYKKIYDEYNLLKEKIKCGLIPKVKKCFSSFFTIHEGDNGIELVVHDDKISNAVNERGFSSLVSKNNCSAEYAHDNYHKRDVSEKQYAIMKSHLVFSTTHTHSTESILNKFFICFVSTIIRSVIENASKIIGINACKFISSIKTVCAIKLVNDSYAYISELSTQQKKIFDFFGIDTNFIDSAIKFINTRGNSINYNTINPIPTSNDNSKNEYQSIFINDTSEINSQDNSNVHQKKKKPGRPKGRKNNATLAKEEELRAKGFDPDAPKQKKTPGRPKGRKNNATLAKEEEMRAKGFDPDAPKQKKTPGRPKGRKNDSTLAREEEMRAKGFDPHAPITFS